MMNSEGKITLRTEEGERLDFFVVEETRLAGRSYLLVTDAEDAEADGECYILKDTSAPEDPEASYEFVVDEQELNALFTIFTQLLDDADVELQK